MTAKLKRLIIMAAAVLVVTGVCCCMPVFAGDTAAEGDALGAVPEVTVHKTEIHNVLEVRNCNAGAVLTDTVKITGGAGRAVTLEKWNRTKKKWVVKSTYKLKDSEGAQKIKIKYPEKWSATTYATWRIHIPEGASDDGKVRYEEAAVKTKTIAYNRYKLPLKAKAACIMDKDGYLIYSKNSTARRAMASTTKMMTATLVIEKGMMNSNVTVSKWAADTAWGILYLKGGEHFTMKSLMNAMLIGSSNESANAIAQKVGGTKNKFVKMMNKRAAELGLKDTHYVNAHGLDSDGHYSTAQDVTRLLMHVSRYSEFRTIASRRSYILRNREGTDSWKIQTTNPLLGKVKGLLYGKTGFEDNAGYCLSVVYKTSGKKYYVTTLGNFTYEGRNEDQRALYRYVGNI